MFGEKKKRWTGPHPVVSCDGKRVLVELGEGTGPRSFNVAQVKPVRLPSVSSLLGNLSSSTAGNVPASASMSPPQTLAPLPIGSTNFYTEVITPSDPRSCQFEEAKKKELEGLLQRDTLKLVLRSELEHNPNIVLSRVVLAIKHKDTGAEVRKARFVLAGHRDKGKRKVVHSATTLKQSSIRLLIALAAILGFDIWYTDINQPYLKSASN